MNSPFIQYYNVFSEENSNYHLSVEELYLYGVLSMLKNVEQLTITSVEVIHQYSPIEFYSRDVESKKRIKKSLVSLKQKGIIQFANDEIKNNTLLIISFPTDLKDDSIGKGVKGFEQVEYKQFNSFSTMIDNYIYFTVKRFDKMGGFNSNYKRWSAILDCAEKTAIDKIDEAVKRGIIYKNIGDYQEDLITNRSQKKQEPNTYKTIPFSGQEKSFETKKVEVKERQQELIKRDTSKEDVQTETEVREHNWNVFGSELDTNDFYIYLTTKDDKLKKRAKARIDAISKNSKGEYMINKLMDEAQDMVREVEKKKERDLLISANNAIRLKSGKIVVVNANNIDNYTYEQIDSIFWANTEKHMGEDAIGFLEQEMSFKSFQPIKKDSHPNVSEYEDRPDILIGVFENYKEFVKTDQRMTYKNIQGIQQEVFREIGVNYYNPYKQVPKIPTIEKQEREEEIDIALIIEDTFDNENEKVENEHSQALEWINKMYNAKNKNRDIGEYSDNGNKETEQEDKDFSDDDFDIFA